MAPESANGDRAEPAEPSCSPRREPIPEFLIGISAVAAICALVAGGIALFG